MYSLVTCRMLKAISEKQTRGGVIGQVIKIGGGGGVQRYFKSEEVRVPKNFDFEGRGSTVWYFIWGVWRWIYI